MTESENNGLRQRIREAVAGEGLRARLLRGGAGSVLIRAGNRLLGLLLGIVLARGLGAEGYGIYAYAFAVMGLLMVLAEAGVPTLLLREVAASLGQARWGLLRGALVRGGQFVGLASVTVSLAGLLVLWAAADRLSHAELHTTLLMLAVLPLAALARMIAHAMRGLERVVAGQVVELLLRPLLVLPAVAALFLYSPALRQPQYAMAAQLVAVAVVVLAGWWALKRNLPAEAASRPPEYRTRQWLKSALPFTLIGGAGIINNQADIIMLGWFRPSADVGIYRVAVQGSVLVAFGLQAANAVVAPHFSRLYAAGDRVRLQRLVTTSARVILLAAVPVAAAFVLAGDAIAAWVFGAEFAASHGALAILSVGQLCNAAFGSVGFLLNMTGHESDTARALWTTAVLNIVLNAALIPFFGKEGAAVASAVSLVTWNVMLYRLVRKQLGIRPGAFAMEAAGS